ncbi:hypothetical protein [Dyadobacter sp. Leaf189]|uniref:DUF7678 domain-containing protein n=1 Tax=Dyadobacter sp. Leaf189 TaxID=1736295 RepID=UPI0006F2B18A|nr:hypothetical protein [Dyadobacter sp. Leaf189]KQS27949.1 hypothetical protein ASG33_16240 [Dyadobacter sp. Leaf189]
MRKMLRKNIRLNEEQIKKLRDLSEFDGSDPLDHVTRAIDDYLRKQKTDLTLPAEKEINAQITGKSPEPASPGAFWVNGIVDRYEFSALILKEASKSAIDKDKVSKLSILDPIIRENTNSFIAACIVNYDRGWDIRPSKIAEPYYRKVRELIDALT